MCLAVSSTVAHSRDEVAAAWCITAQNYERPPGKDTPVSVSVSFKNRVPQFISVCLYGVSSTKSQFTETKSFRVLWSLWTLCKLKSKQHICSVWGGECLLCLLHRLRLQRADTVGSCLSGCTGSPAVVCPMSEKYKEIPLRAQQVSWVMWLQSCRLKSPV